MKIIATDAYRPSAGYVQRLRDKLNSLEHERMTSLDLEALTASDLAFKEALDGLQLMNLKDALQEILVMYDLQGLYDYYLSYNTALNAPYHNHYHAACMLANCLEGAHHEGLSELETRQLLVAALFHDFDHTAGRQADLVNIKLAGMAVSMLPSQGLLSTRDSETVRELVEVTCYPFTRAPETPAQRIIRDADLMQVYEDDEARLKEQYLGLKREVEVRLGRGLTLQEFIEGQGKFFKKQVVWYTEWAQRKAGELNFDARCARLARVLGASQGCVN